MINVDLPVALCPPTIVTLLILILASLIGPKFFKCTLILSDIKNTKIHLNLYKIKHLNLLFLKKQNLI